MKKLLSRIALITLSLSLLAGCGGTDAPAETEEPAVPALAAETQEPEPEETAPPEPDFDRAYGKYAPETTVLTVAGVELNWDKYYSALRQYAYSLYAYYGITDFGVEAEEDGGSAGAWVRDMAENDLRSMAVFHAWAAELGLRLTEEDYAAIDAEIQEYADVYFDGDREALFQDMMISEDYYRFEAEAARLYDAVFASYFGEGGSLLTDGDALAWAEDNGCLYAKHILFKTVDDDGTPLDGETAAEKLAAAQDALARLLSCAPGTLAETFDELMHALSEDPGLAAYPDGYYFQEGDMVDEFYQAALGLEEGQLSGIVEGPYGYHILYRPPMDPDHVFGMDSNYEPYTLRYYVASTLFGGMAAERYEAAPAVYAREFENLDLAQLFSE